MANVAGGSDSEPPYLWEVGDRSMPSATRKKVRDGGLEWKRVAMPAPRAKTGHGFVEDLAQSARHSRFRMSEPSLANAPVSEPPAENQTTGTTPENASPRIGVRLVSVTPLAAAVNDTSSHGIAPTAVGRSNRPGSYSLDRNCSGFPQPSRRYHEFGIIPLETPRFWRTKITDHPYMTRYLGLKCERSS